MQNLLLQIYGINLYTYKSLQGRIQGKITYF